ncbi:hypothetical protein ISS21_01275 [Patescibacteria group bacterium]|nr:hypothetical protein [Patescibacteria group bacterium]
MTLKKYLNLMVILTIICWLAWVLLLFFITPVETGLIGFILFYFSLFLAIVGTAAIIGFIIRVRLSRGPVFKQVEVAFRQGIWISLLIVGLILLQGLNLLKWWNGLLLALFLIFLEFFFLSSRKRYKV